MKEIFKSVKGYEGLYEISNMGVVRSIVRKGRRSNIRLKFGMDGKGYCQVNLRKEGKGKTFRVHRLVAITYIPNSKNKPQINHKDGNKQNNKVTNLEWSTHKENIDHAIDMGLQAKGEKHYKTKLTKKDVLEIREKAYTVPNKLLAKDYGVSKSVISHVIK